MRPDARVEARASAVVILVRDGPSGLETFMVRRHARTAVSPNVYVFPGGTVRGDDIWLDHDAAALGATLSARSDTPVTSEQGLGLYVCAVRELFEEAGVLLAGDVSHAVLGRWLESPEALQELREALQRRDLSLSAALTRGHWRPAFQRLIPFAHWVTPTGLDARFDTRFFVAEMPAGQEALHCAIETSAGAWLTPAALLESPEDLVFATRQHLRRLLPFSQVADLPAFASEKPIRRVQPTMEWQGSRWTPVVDPLVRDAW